MVGGFPVASHCLNFSARDLEAVEDKNRAGERRTYWELSVEKAIFFDRRVAFGHPRDPVTGATLAEDVTVKNRRIGIPCKKVG